MSCFQFLLFEQNTSQVLVWNSGVHNTLIRVWPYVVCAGQALFMRLCAIPEERAVFWKQTTSQGKAEGEREKSIVESRLWSV